MKQRNQIAIGILTLACLLAGCSNESSDPAVPPAIEDAVFDILGGIEERAVGRVLDHLSYDFKSEDDLGFVDVQAVVETFLLRGEVIGVRLENLSIEPLGDEQGKRERVQAWVSFARRKVIETEKPLPAGAVTYAFDLVFEHMDGRWQALSGSYKRE